MHRMRHIGSSMSRCEVVSVELHETVCKHILATSVLDANSSGHARAGYDGSRDSRDDGSGDGEDLEHVELRNGMEVLSSKDEER